MYCYPNEYHWHKVVQLDLYLKKGDDSDVLKILIRKNIEGTFYCTSAHSNNMSGEHQYFVK